MDRHDQVQQWRALRHQCHQRYGCLTMYNTSTNTVSLIEPYIGDATGIAAVKGLHKVYAAQGGQVYIFSTVDGSSINNQYVTVTGTAYDVAYMDGIPTPITPSTDNPRFDRSRGVEVSARADFRPMCWPLPRIATTWSRPAAEPCCAWLRAACARRSSISPRARPEPAAPPKTAPAKPTKQRACLGVGWRQALDPARWRDRKYARKSR